MGLVGQLDSTVFSDLWSKVALVFVFGFSLVADGCASVAVRLRLVSAQPRVHS